MSIYRGHCQTKWSEEELNKTNNNEGTRTPSSFNMDHDSQHISEDEFTEFTHQAKKQQMKGLEYTKHQLTIGKN